MTADILHPFQAATPVGFVMKADLHRVLRDLIAAADAADDVATAVDVLP